MAGQRRGLRRVRPRDVAGVAIPRLTKRQQALVADNQGLIYLAVNKLGPEALHIKDDIIQECSLGLARAAQLYNRKHKSTFSTYAWYWIQQKIYKMLNDAGTIRRPKYISYGSGLEPQHSVSYLDHENPRHDPVDQRPPSVPKELKDLLRNGLRQLPLRERIIIRSRWLDRTPLTFSELGALLHVSRERVRQLELEALESLRRTRGLRDYLPSTGK